MLRYFSELNSGRKYRLPVFALGFTLLSLVFSCSDSSGSNKGKQETTISFSEVTSSAGLSYGVGDDSPGVFDRFAAGVAVDDIDNDGYLDLLLAHGANEPAKLFLNQKDGSFEDITSVSGIVTSTQARGALFVDLDRDGLNDILVSEPIGTNLIAYKNDGDGSYSLEAGTFGLAPLGYTFSLAAGDYDRDGFLDIAIAQYYERPTYDEYEGWLWRNTLSGFVDATDDMDIADHVAADPLQDNREFQWNFSPSFSDLNNDGYQDLLFAATFNTSMVNQNNAGVGFSLTNFGDLTDEAGMGSAIGDYDNDGDLDWFVTSIWVPEFETESKFVGTTGNRLYENDGSGDFTDVSETAGVREGYFGWGACFADFDLDGDLDLFHVNGDDEVTFAEDPAVFFLNNGDGTFTEMASEIGIDHTGQGRGVSCLDIDNDGDRDILIANAGTSPSLYRNNTETENNFFIVELEGLTGNKQGVGARVEITSGDKTQIREIRAGSNFLSNDPLLAHFGVGKAQNIDLVRVRWNDASENLTEVEDVTVNQKISIQHPDL